MDWSKISYKSLGAFISVPFLAAICAWINIGAKNGSVNLLWLFGSSLVVCIPWAVITRHSAMSLAVSGSVFDALYGIFHLAAFILLGQAVSSIQLVGACIIIVGLILMSL